MSRPNLFSDEYHGGCGGNMRLGQRPAVRSMKIIFGRPRCTSLWQVWPVLPRVGGTQGTVKIGLPLTRWTTGITLYMKQRATPSPAIRSRSSARRSPSCADDGFFVLACAHPGVGEDPVVRDPAEG